MRRRTVVLLLAALAGAAAACCFHPSTSATTLQSAASDGGDVPVVTASGYASTGDTRNRLFYVYYEVDGGHPTDDTPLIVWLEVR